MSYRETHVTPYEVAKLKLETQLLKIKAIEEKYRVQIEVELAKRKLESLKASDGKARGDVQRTALNGAQISSMLQVIQSVTEGKLPVDSGVTVLQVAFPEISAELAEKILAPIREKQEEEQRKEEEKEEERENPDISGIFGDEEDEEEDGEEDGEPSSDIFGDEEETEDEQAAFDEALFEDLEDEGILFDETEDEDEGISEVTYE